MRANEAEPLGGEACVTAGGTAEAGEIAPGDAGEAVSGPGSDGMEGGIVAALGDLQPGSLVTLRGLARMLGRSEDSIQRAVRRGELPPPVRVLGKRAWTAGSVVRHIEARLAQAAAEAERAADRIRAHRP